MDKVRFRDWMLKEKSNNTIRTYIARCIRVEMSLGINLDEEFLNDGGKEVLYKLKYSRDDERKGVMPECGICFANKVNIYEGMHSLRASVKKYFDFMIEIKKMEEE